MNNDISHEEQTGSLQQPISCVVTTFVYEETFVGSINGMLSKRIIKSSLKLREKTADCHMAAYEGNPQTEKQALQRDKSNKEKQLIHCEINSLGKIGTSRLIPTPCNANFVGNKKSVKKKQKADDFLNIHTANLVAQSF